ncbi:MAG: hypothetical protein AAB766_04990 [Patescibacteria group bacterium]
MKKVILLVIVLCSMFASSISFANNNSVPISYGANIGAIEVINLPDEAHLGLYPYIAGSIIVPAGSTSLVTTLGVEWSPEFKRWGFVPSFMVDVPVASWLGLDVMTSFVHDQEGSDWNSALFFLGFGPGATVYLGHWSVSPSFVTYRGLNVQAWTFVPGLNVGYTF